MRQIKRNKAKSLKKESKAVTTTRSTKKGEKIMNTEARSSEMDRKDSEYKYTSDYLKSMEEYSSVKLNDVDISKLNSSWSNDILVDRIVEKYLRGEEYVLDFSKIHIDDNLKIVIDQEAFDAYLRLCELGKQSKNIRLRKLNYDAELFDIENATDEDITRKIACTGSIYRRLHFEKLSHLMPDKLYWELLGFVYGQSEFFFDEDDYEVTKWWIKELKTNRAEKEYFVDEKSRDYFQSMEEEITVYRGMNTHEIKEIDGSLGLAWTTDFDMALKHAGYISISPEIIIEARVKKADCTAYMDFEETIVSPSIGWKNVVSVHMMDDELKKMPSQLTQAYIESHKQF